MKTSFEIFVNLSINYFVLDRRQKNKDWVIFTINNFDCDYGM